MEIVGYRRKRVRVDGSTRGFEVMRNREGRCWLVLSIRLSICHVRQLSEKTIGGGCVEITGDRGKGTNWMAVHRALRLGAVYI